MQSVEQDKNLHMAAHQDFHIFKLRKTNLTQTPLNIGVGTTEIRMSSLFKAIQDPSAHPMTRRTLPDQAYQFHDFVMNDFVKTHLAKIKMQYQNSTASNSLSTMATEGNVPQKLVLKLKTVTLGNGFLQEEEATKLNKELEAIATAASKENLAALQRSRGRLDQSLSNFDPRAEIHEQASIGYENLCGGKGSINFLDKTWHAIDDQERSFYLSDTLYSIAVYNGLIEAERLHSELQAEANAKKLKKEEEEKLRTAADAIMQNASDTVDEKAILEKFQKMMHNETKDLRAEIKSLKHQLKNRGGGQAARGGHQQQHTAQQQGRGRGRGRGHQAPQDQSPQPPRGRGQVRGRGRGRGRSQSRPSSRPSSRPASRSASPSGSTRRHQPSSSNQETHRPWFAPPSRIIVQTRPSAASLESRAGGWGQAQGQRHPQQSPRHQSRDRGRGRGRGQPRGRSRSRSNSSERPPIHRSRSREDGSPQGRGRGRGNPAQRGRGRGRGARGRHQSPQQHRP